MKKIVFGLAILLGMVLAPQSALAEQRYELCGGNYSYVSYDYSNWDTNSSMTVYYWIYNSSNELVAYGWTRDPGAGKGRGKIQSYVNLYGAKLDACVEEFRANVDQYVITGPKVNLRFEDARPFNSFNSFDDFEVTDFTINRFKFK